MSDRVKNEDSLFFDMEAFGRSIKKYRALRGLTQTELAQRLFVAPQSVSKWERGENVPDLARFYSLARVLSISADELLGGRLEEKTFIGIDGGGTKTEFVLINQRGDLLNSVLLGGSNPNTCGLDAAFSLLKQGIDFFSPRDMNVCGIFFGGAGLGSADHADALRTRLKKAYPHVLVDCSTDIANVIACGSSPDNCIAAICGTGSVVFASADGRLIQTGGAGYLFDPVGSGYGLGRAAILAALEDRDGTGPATALTAPVEQRLGGPAWKRIPDLYKMDVSGVAAFAPLLLEAAREGDSVAADILEEHCRHLAHLITVASRKAPKARSLVLAGGLFQRSELFCSLLAQHLPRQLKPEVLTCPPVWGACLRSLQLCGVEELPSRERFMEQYREV